MTTSENSSQNSTQLYINYGHCSQQGIRQSMEDRVILNNNLLIENACLTSGVLSLFAVFDGHGGNECSNYAATLFTAILTANLTNVPNEYQTPTGSAQSNASTNPTYTMSQMFERCIADLDSKCIALSKDASGSTACIVLVDRRRCTVWCCNVGDSRCVLLSNGCTKVLQLSTEHKPDYPLERERIENANGWVTKGRVCGILAVSRSLGDKDFKQENEALVSSVPDVNRYSLTQLNEYIVLACDGLFDVFTNEDACQWIQARIVANDNESNNDDSNHDSNHDSNSVNENRLSSFKSLERLSTDIVNESIQKRFSTDNVSVIILKLSMVVANKNNNTNTNNNNNNNNNNQNETETEAEAEPESSAVKTNDTTPEEIMT